jgi:hypothetical protein
MEQPNDEHHQDAMHSLATRRAAAAQSVAIAIKGKSKGAPGAAYDALPIGVRIAG